MPHNEGNKKRKGLEPRTYLPYWRYKASTQKELIWKEQQHENYVLKNFIEALEKHFDSEYYIKEDDSEKIQNCFWFDN